MTAAPSLNEHSLPTQAPATNPPRSISSSPVFLPSRSPSPPLSTTSHRSAQTRALSDLNSGAEAGNLAATTSTHRLTARAINNASELPSLRRQHVTEGYRAGVSAGRSDATIAQEAFDQGFLIGGGVGVRVGWVLGCLRALCTSESEKWEEEGAMEEGPGKERRKEWKKEMKGMKERAEKELVVERFVEGLASREKEEEEGEEKVINAQRGSGREQVNSAKERWNVLNQWLDVVEELGRARGVDLAFPG